MIRTFFLTVIMALSFSTAPARAAEQEVSPEARQTAAIAAPAPDQAPAVSTAAAQQPPLYAQEILSALKNLSTLLSKSARVDRKELGVVAGEIIKLDARVKALLGPALLKEIADQEEELENKARIELAKEELAKARSAILLYYGDLDGKYPAAPAALVPGYLPAAPELELPGHARTGAVELTDSAGPDMTGAVTDTGGWLYFTNPASQNFGMLILNCSHKDDKGTELYKY